MIIVKLMGGLGNQMFQYALGRQLALRHNTELKLDLHFLLDRTPGTVAVFRDYDLDIFNMAASVATKEEVMCFTCPPYPRAFQRLRRRALPKQVKRERHFHFDPSIEAAPNDVYLDGYWQSPRYFESTERVIRRDFTYSDRYPHADKTMAERIRNTVSICVNVRRKDFVGSPLHDVCTPEYFRRGVGYVRARERRSECFVFSDDIDWCQEHLALDSPVTFIGHEFAGQKFGAYLQLMSACRHFVIPNSTFAWWAVWLNEHSSKIVVAPAKWFNDPAIDSTDLIPQSWMRL